MARTSNSRGKTPFSMRSNNKTSFKNMGSSSPIELSDSSNPNFSESIYSDPNDSGIGDFGVGFVGANLNENNIGKRQPMNLKELNKFNEPLNKLSTDDFWSQYSF